MSKSVLRIKTKIAEQTQTTVSDVDVLIGFYLRKCRNRFSGRPKAGPCVDVAFLPNSILPNASRKPDLHASLGTLFKSYQRHLDLDTSIGLSQYCVLAADLGEIKAPRL